MHLLICNRTLLQKLTVAQLVKQHFTPYAVVTSRLLSGAGTVCTCTHVDTCRRYLSLCFFAYAP